MLIVNLGKYGMTKDGFFFPPGVNVNVSEELGEYLLKTYKKKHPVYFQKALDAQQHFKVMEKVAPVTDEPVKKKQGRPKKVQ